MKKLFLNITNTALKFRSTVRLGRCSGDGIKKQLEINSELNNLEETALTCRKHGKITQNNNNETVNIKSGEEIVLDADHLCKVNTVTIRESGCNCTGFSIYSEDETGKREFLFGGDVIDNYLYCAFKNVDVSRLIIKIDSAKNGKDVKITQINTYCAKSRSNDDFIVNSYFPVEKGCTYFQDRVNDKEFSKYFDVITDAIIIAAVEFKKDASLEYDSETLKKETQALKQIIGDRNIKIWCCVANPKKENGKHANNHSVYAIKHNLDILKTNLVNLCNEYGFCGIDFDWEFPWLPHVWSAYSKMLVGLGKKLHKNDLLLSSALGPWGVRLTDEAKKSLDIVNVMAYDWAKNIRNNHGEFYSCHYYSAEYFLKQGFRKNQILLGLPFYGNTRDDGKFLQAGYSDFEISSKTQNTGVKEGREYYFNGYDMIFSKTAYTYDTGFAGAMIWCGKFDLPMSSQYSLFSAMKDSLESRVNSD